MYFFQHCVIYRLSESAVSEDAGIEPRTDATLELAFRRSYHSVRSHPTLLDTIIGTFKRHAKHILDVTVWLATPGTS
jgi:hypothetical protein